ncbi:SCO family protein [Natrialbaceae archaeon GCM10025810]|uniref:SCO family protein n=1 Tax=Halovalidus salilacus TaxID=3075124 RepID=UPI00362103A8
MERRTYLRSLGVAGVAGTAGCLDDLPAMGSDGEDRKAEGTVLGPPEQKRGEPSHPTYGDEIPSFSIEDPLTGEEISPEEFEGERAFLMTFIYTNCTDNVCPMLLSKLRYAQEKATDGDYSDEVAFLAMTFDPDRDDTDALQEEGEEQSVDFDAGNWHFLRPEDNDEAEEIVNGTFGVPYEQEDLEEHDHGDGNESGNDHDETENESGHDHGDGNESETDHESEGGNESDDGGDVESIVHYDLILLVNDRGIVERSYPQATGVEGTRIAEDLETVVEG